MTNCNIFPLYSAAIVDVAAAITDVTTSVVVTNTSTGSG
jgi:hypothetical protein